MIAPVNFQINTASTAVILDHLRACDAEFIPSLTSRLSLELYASKIAARAMRIEAWADDNLIGLAALYCNECPEQAAFLTSISVLRSWQGKGLGHQLLHLGLARARDAGCTALRLEVDPRNTSALHLYARNGFIPGPVSGSVRTMHLFLNTR